MAENEWDKYIVQPPSSQSNDEWSQYAQQPPKASSSMDSLMGIGLGGAAMAGAGIGLAKTGIPQGMVGGIGKIASGITNMPKVANVQKGAAFEDSIRSAFIKAHADKVTEFGGDIDKLSLVKPDAKVNLANHIEEIKADWKDLTPEAKSVFRKTPILNKMLSEKGASSPEITLKQSQEIINYLNTKVPKNIRFNNLEILDTLNNIRGSQLEAFPEMEGVRANYKKFIEPYNNVKQYFKFNKLLNNIKNKFGGASGQAAVEKILPKEVIKKMGGYRAAAKLAELPQDIPLFGRTIKSLSGMALAPQVLGAIEFAIKMDELKKKAKASPKGSVMATFNEWGIPREVTPEELMI